MANLEWCLSGTPLGMSVAGWPNLAVCVWDFLEECPASDAWTIWPAAKATCIAPPLYFTLFSFPGTWAWMSNRVFPLTRPLISPAETSEQELIVTASSTQATQCIAVLAWCRGDKGSDSQGCFEMNQEECRWIKDSKLTVNWRVYMVCKKAKSLLTAQPFILMYLLHFKVITFCF